VKKVAKVRRAKLSFLRGRKGKAARMSERFTGADEFAVAIAPAVEAPAVEAATEAAPTEAVKEEKTETKGSPNHHPQQESLWHTVMRCNLLCSQNATCASNRG
jgi:uncharacterized membrane protein